ncbi:hypothetical protein GCM10007977_022090 [Dactylosporangium sucinum]|uniref:Uncharacterized protein n=1 Tax=Dactylosporangium sucinum TaxID=1424081 RepID=A0A917TES0_9ACTN|nr:hypothetical protein GCM10007977_022090 [Dactylosporangium sucinum]
MDVHAEAAEQGRHLSERSGTVGKLHDESHGTDPSERAFPGDFDATSFVFVDFVKELLDDVKYDS